MRVLLSWLREFIDITDSIEVIANKLTMAGLEVEGIERYADDAVIEVNVTPNRGDCLSVVGIARELSAIYNKPINLPELDILAEMSDLNFNVDIIDPDLCYRYAGRVIRNVTISHSPQWMQKRLELCGLRAINNIVDITNYVLLELGHPLHAFDADMLEGNTIRVGTPKSIDPSVSTFITLDGQERKISQDTLLIWDATKPVAIAGVMGGKSSEVSDKTVNIFLESAWFEPTTIRRTSKALALKTEASYRFERIADIKMLKKALDRATLLIKNLASGSIQGKIDIYPKKLTSAPIKCRTTVVNKTIGISFSTDEVADCLKRLHMVVKPVDEDTLEVSPPTFRSDIQAEIDLIEEVARLYGFDNIPSILPIGQIGLDSEKLKQKNSFLARKQKVKSTMLAYGFSEAINLSFMSVAELQALNLSPDDFRYNALPIRNPLTTNTSHMRTTLIPALLRNLKHNLAYDINELRLFEIAKVFLPGRNESSNPRDAVLPAERHMLGAIFYRQRHKSLYHDSTEDFYIIKGVLQAVLASLGVRDCIYKRSTEPFLHPGKSADLFVNFSSAGLCKVGFIGYANYALIEGLDIKASKPSLTLFEIDLDALLSLECKPITYKPLPKYPHIDRDTAVVVDKALDAYSLMQILKSFESNLIEQITIFDVYQGQGLPEDKKSIAYTVRYRSSERTLTDDEVQTLHEQLTNYVLSRTSGQLRT